MISVSSRPAGSPIRPMPVACGRSSTATARNIRPASGPPCRKSASSTIHPSAMTPPRCARPMSLA